MAESYMKTLIEELSKVLSPDNVFGQPIEHEDKMIIPVILSARALLSDRSLLFL